MDINYLLVLQNFREATGGIFDFFMIALSELGGGTAAVILTTVFVWCIDKKKGYFIMFASGITGIICQAVKLIACVYRPWVRDPRVQPMEAVKPGATGYSFPSGHTANAASTYGAIAVAYRKKKAVAAIFIIIALGIAFSRNYAGVHTPQDVLVGMLCGILGMWVAAISIKWADQKKNHDLVICLTGIVLVIAAMLFVTFKSYPMDYVNGGLLVDPKEMMPDFFAVAGCIIGFLISWIIERRWVCFQVEGPVWVRILRGVVGCIGLVLLQVFVFQAINAAVGICAGYVIRGIILYLYVLVGYPLLFGFVEKKRK